MFETTREKCRTLKEDYGTLAQPAKDVADALLTLCDELEAELKSIIADILVLWDRETSLAHSRVKDAQCP